MINKLFLILLLSIYSYGSFEQKNIKIYNVNSKYAKIKIGKLKIGQSGIILHKYNKNQSIIISSAIVVRSNKSSSKIKFIEFDNLLQDSLPTTNLKPRKSDTFVLNFLYSKSMLIAPNIQSYQKINKNFKNQTFLNSDIFASYLKLTANPTPKKDDFKEFCRIHNLGTIYFVVGQKMYVVDSKSFKIIKRYKLSYNETEEEEPFYTKVEKIEKNFFNFFQSSSIGNYKKYYSNLLGL